VGTGIIYAAIVVAWAAYLLPLVKHHREQPSATRDARATDGMRVLGKRSSGARARRSDASETAALASDRADEVGVGADVATPVEVSRPRYDAAARRRRVLFLILATAVVTAVFAYVGLLAWWALAIPGGLLVGFVVLARLSVRAARSARRRASHRSGRTSQPADKIAAAAPTSRRSRRHAAADTDTRSPAAATSEAGTAEAVTTASAPPDLADPAVAWVAHSPVDAWDPLPVTLPTYVTKDAAPARRVRTIDLSGAAAFSAGRLPEAELLSRQPASVEDLGSSERGADGAHAATG
jgi:hypothetical protein